MAPSSVNDTARINASELACYRDDTAGAIVTAGTSTAYTVSSYESFDTLAHLSGQVIAFSPHATNAATVTLNVDSLGAKPLRSSPGVELQSGVLVQGTPYVALYNNTDGAFYLFGCGAAPGIPLAVTLEYWGSTTPGSAFAFAAGQAISRTTYATLFTVFGTGYGTGDGSTTFNIPDLRGRVRAGADNMGGTAAGRLTSASGMGVGAVGQTGGGETETLLTVNLPAYTPSGSIANGAISGTAPGFIPNANSAGGGGNAGTSTTVAISASQGASSFSGNAQGGTSTPLGNVQPTIVCNCIMRII